MAAALAVSQLRYNPHASLDLDRLGSASIRSGKKQLPFRFLNNAEIFTCFCTACNALKFLKIRAGSSRGSRIHEHEKKNGNAKRILAAGEGICLSAAVASHVVCVLQQRHLSHQQQMQEQSVASPCCVPGAFRYTAMPTLQLLPLWLAVLFNILLRFLQTRDTTGNARSDENLAPAQRMAALEEDLHSSVSVIRALTRQVEKLGVRVQVTRRTLQDPIQQTAKLAGNMSEVVKALSSRESLLEQELKETRSALLAMQEQQSRQLELISKLVQKSNKLEAELVDYKQASNNNKQSNKKAGAIEDDYKYDYWLTNNTSDNREPLLNQK